MASHDDALAEGLVGGHGEALSQFGVAGEEEAQAVVGVHAVVGEQAEFLEQVAGEEMGLVDDQDRELAAVSQSYPYAEVFARVLGNLRKAPLWHPSG